ncbi:MAG: glycosidase [Anaerolineales bacterium]|nr:glycosidase [Anaerolineales bacterium]
MKLRRHPLNPILLPDPTSHWESKNVFNPSVVFHNGLYHMHYRAQGDDWVSRIGYAVSQDGVNWNRLRQPVLAPEGSTESRGVEDPRVTEINGVFYMAYTGYSGKDPSEDVVTPMFAESTNLLDWARIGPLVEGEDNKDHFLLPKKLHGQFVAVHRPYPNIWIAESEDLINWPREKMSIIMSPRPDNHWDSVSIGGNGPPIETEHGWLMFYHGYEESRTYRFGVCMLALDDPTQVLNRPREWVFEPRESWELQGHVPNVVFSCANLRVGDQVWVYYAGADRVIGLATCSYEEIVEFARFG